MTVGCPFRAESREIIITLLCTSASFSLSLEEKTSEGETFLTLAVKAGLVENVKMLLDHGASPHTANNNNESPLLLGQNTFWVYSVPHSRHVVLHQLLILSCPPCSSQSRILSDGFQSNSWRSSGGAGVSEEVDGHARGVQGRLRSCRGAPVAEWRSSFRDRPVWSDSSGHRCRVQPP